MLSLLGLCEVSVFTSLSTGNLFQNPHGCESMDMQNPCPFRLTNWLGGLRKLGGDLREPLCEGFPLVSTASKVSQIHGSNALTILGGSYGHVDVPFVPEQAV